MKLPLCLNVLQASLNQTARRVGNLATNSLRVLLLLLLIFQPVHAMAVSCVDAFIEDQRLVDSNNAKNITNLEDFAGYLTRGMLLSAEQKDLFEIYRILYFGDSKTPLNDGIAQVYDELKLHPNLTKIPFSEFDISYTEKVYETPEQLLKHIQSMLKVSGQFKTNAFMPLSNLGFWKKILHFKELTAPEEFDKKAKQAFEKAQNEKFTRYLSLIIGKDNRIYLADQNADYLAKIKVLFKTLNQLRSLLEKRNFDTKFLRQAMVDLVALSGYSNAATIELLKSKNGIKRIEGLKKILDERDAVAMDLGYSGHFRELLQKLDVDFVTGSAKGSNDFKTVERLEKLVLDSRFFTRTANKIRVRSLSLLEAPFRSCLGGSDCSSRTYFKKALDPNYHYFTMTDSDQKSSGHVTVVLGVAKDQIGKDVKVAFVDKIQNIPNSMLNIFLSAVQKSVGERGYALALPNNLGDHNGISNMDTTIGYVRETILPRLSQSLERFTPHENEYMFNSGYSRAYHKLDVFLYEGIIENGSEISNGITYQSFLAPKGLSKEGLAQELNSLLAAQDKTGMIKCIKSAKIFLDLEKIGLLTPGSFDKRMTTIFENKENGFEVRSLSFIAKILHGNLSVLDIPAYFIESEVKLLAAEVKQWAHSTDALKKKKIKDFYIKSLKLDTITDSERKFVISILPAEYQIEFGIRQNDFDLLLSLVMGSAELEKKSYKAVLVKALENAKILKARAILNFIFDYRSDLVFQKDVLGGYIKLYGLDTRVIKLIEGHSKEDNDFVMYEFIAAAAEAGRVSAEIFNYLDNHYELSPQVLKDLTNTAASKNHWSVYHYLIRKPNFDPKDMISQTYLSSNALARVFADSGSSEAKKVIDYAIENFKKISISFAYHFCSSEKTNPVLRDYFQTWMKQNRLDILKTIYLESAKSNRKLFIYLIEQLKIITPSWNEMLLAQALKLYDWELALYAAQQPGVNINMQLDLSNNTWATTPLIVALSHSGGFTTTNGSPAPGSELLLYLLSRKDIEIRKEIGGNSALKYILSSRISLHDKYLKVLIPRMTLLERAKLKFGVR